VSVLACPLISACGRMPELINTFLRSPMLRDSPSYFSLTALTSLVDGWRLSGM
jgi:hypothetical protein